MAVRAGGQGGGEPAWGRKPFTIRFGNGCTRVRGKDGLGKRLLMRGERLFWQGVVILGEGAYLEIPVNKDINAMVAFTLMLWPIGKRKCPCHAPKSAREKENQKRGK